MASEQFSLCWDNFHKNMSSGMNSLLENEDLVDVTLAVQGKCLKAHKMVLSVCSPYFKELFKSNPCQHPIVFMKDVSYEALSDLLQFMYQGEVQVSQENLTTFIKTAEALQIKGLTGDGNGSADVEPEVMEKPVVRHHEEHKMQMPRPKKQPPPQPVVAAPSAKRSRMSSEMQSTSSLATAAVTKHEPHINTGASVAQPEAVHFKMEPYDQTSGIDETGDETFGDDTLDDTGVDDSEDYSMMEGGTMGDDGTTEPQAGTSGADGTGEGQVVTVYKRRGQKNEILMYNNFEYKMERTTPYRLMWCCTQKEKTKCKARVVTCGDKLLLKFRHHNHSPIRGGDSSRYRVMAMTLMSKTSLKDAAKWGRIEKDEGVHVETIDGSYEVIFC